MVESISVANAQAPRKTPIPTNTQLILYVADLIWSDLPRAKRNLNPAYTSMRPISGMPTYITIPRIPLIKPDIPPSKPELTSGFVRPSALTNMLENVFMIMFYAQPRMPLIIVLYTIFAIMYEPRISAIPTTA